MPHTTTKAIRTKRLDTRPNAKQRKAMAKIIDKKSTIQDIRVTKVQTDEKQERDSIVGQELKSTKTTKEKVYKALKKKLVAIEELIKRQKNGEELDPQQQAKVDRLDSILLEMEKFIPDNNTTTEET